MTETRRTFHFPGITGEASWRLKLVGWWQVVGGSLLILSLAQAVAMGVFVLDVHPSVPIAAGILLLFTMMAARVYAGLMLLDRSRSAGVLCLLVTALQLVATLKSSSLISISVLMAIVNFALVASIWDELDGPLPFGARSSKQVFLGIACVCLIATLARPPRFQGFAGSPSDESITFASPSPAAEHDFIKP